jgi:hypothetical protein
MLKGKNPGTLVGVSPDIGQQAPHGAAFEGAGPDTGSVGKVIKAAGNREPHWIQLWPGAAILPSGVSYAGQDEGAARTAGNDASADGEGPPVADKQGHDLGKGSHDRAKGEAGGDQVGM